MNMAGKVVVVTGASMGIGEAIAGRFLREGASVVFSSRDLARVEEARQRVGAAELAAARRTVARQGVAERGVAERTLAIACDVTVRAQIEALLAAAIERFGRIDVWVNNAGFGLVDSVDRMDMAACRSMFDTNLFGAIEAMQVVSPVLKQQRSGAIVNVSSMAGLLSVPYMAAYGATKHALNCIGRAARLELAPYGVHVNTVCPGYVRTDFNRHAVWGGESLRVAGDRKRGVTAERTADAVWYAYRFNRRLVVVPWSGHLLVGFSRVLPGIFNWGMLRMLRRLGDSGER
jgi:NAD(P)-dependent dehydrogenase (short-subunit alcohol dehydrogenase family)